MINKEQLEYWEKLWGTGYSKFVPDLLEYAKEQITCTQELKEYKKSYEGVSKALDNMSEMLLNKEQQNKHYREIFKKISDLKNDEHFNPYAYMMLEIVEWAEIALNSKLRE